MSMLIFGVILVSFVFNIIVAFGFCLVEFSQNVHLISSRNDISRSDTGVGPNPVVGSPLIRDGAVPFSVLATT
jgi:hypothetical protein